MADTPTADATTTPSPPPPGETCDVSGFVTFTLKAPDGGVRASFAVDATEMHFALDDLAEQLGKEGKTDRDYLKAIIDLVERQTGVRMTLGEADHFRDMVTVARVRQKKTTRDAIIAMRP
jgi:hypothetical protein